MNFNNSVKNSLLPLLYQYNFKIVNETENYLKFGSDSVIIVVSHNKRENSNSVWIGRTDSLETVELRNVVLKYFFKSDILLENVPTDVFVQNLTAFLENKALLILAGDSDYLHLLEEYDRQRSKSYTRKIQFDSKLQEADNAWTNNEYKKFIEIVNELDHTLLPKSYDLKYRIALNKMK